MAQHPEPAVSFEELWADALPALVDRCRHTTPNRADAEELLSSVAERAWRGFPPSRCGSSFATWVLRIAEREAACRAQAERERAQHEVPFRIASHDRAAESGPTPRDGLVPALVACAHECGELSVLERDAVLARLGNPRPTWHEVAATIGGSANACAVAHSRAVPKLRVHALHHHADVFGGVAVVRAAFETIQTRTPAALSERQAKAFDGVLRGGTHHRQHGRRGAVRVAAGLVAAELRE